MIARSQDRLSLRTLGIHRAAWLAAAIAVLAALTLAASARAGTWALASCAQPDGKPAPIQGWQAGGAGSNKGSLSTCSSTGGALIAQVRDEVEQPAYQPATWTFTAPSGSTIAGGTLSLAMYTPEGQDYAETPANSYDTADVVGNCQYNTGTCASQWNSEIAPIQPDQAGGSQIFLGAECVALVEGHDFCQQPGDPNQGANGLDAQINLYAALIDLQNDSTPTGTGFSGGLLAPDASRTQDLLFTASDPSGPGVYSVSATIDGATVYNQTPDSNSGQCQSIGTDPSGAREFLSEQPCKQTESVDIPVNTATLAAGQHQLRITVTDAAGNSALVYSTSISTDNPPTETGTPTLHDTSRTSGAPEPGDVLQISPGAWNPSGTTLSYAWQSCQSDGSNCGGLAGQTTAQYTVQPADAGHVLIGIITATTTAGSRQVQAGVTPAVLSPSSAAGSGITGAQSPVLQGNGSTPILNVTLAVPSVAHVANGTPCAGAQLSLMVDGKARLSPIRYGRGATIKGLLHCGQLAIHDARVLFSGGGLTGAVQTNAQGSFVYSVPPGPGRTLTFAYTAYSDDSVPAATGRAIIPVYPIIKLAITPRLTQNDGTVTWQGNITGGPYPTDGVTMLVQVREGRRWQTFDQITTRNGRFAYRYTFRRTTLPTTYTFRVTLPESGSAGYPYAPAGSNTVRVHVA